MRKIIIWTLIVLIAIGFIYVGNNLFTANVSFTNILDVLPDSSILIKFSDRSAVTSLFPELSHSLFGLSANTKNNSGYIILNNNDAAMYVRSSDTISPFDATLLSLKSSGYNDIKTFWEDGFPVADAASLNQEVFSSSWRGYKIYALNKDILENVFKGILQKGNLIRKNSAFSVLWNGKSDAGLQGFVSSSGSNFLENNIKIPFLNFAYPLTFNYSHRKVIIENVSSDSADLLNYNPFTFQNSVLTFALPHMTEIKKNLLKSGLSFLIANKIGISFDSLSLLSSYSGGEFVLFNKDNFLLMVKSTPEDNGIYREELKNNLSDIKEEKILTNGFPMAHFSNNYVNFYTLEFPDGFFIATSKEILDEIANGNVKRVINPDLIQFLMVSKKFNKIIDLYNLNVKEFSLSNNDIKLCTVSVFQSGDKKTTIIELK